MYKFDKDLEKTLEHFIGAEVQSIQVDPYNLLFNFDTESAINVCGVWRLLDAKGDIVDEGDCSSSKPKYVIGDLLCQKIEKILIISPEVLSIVFGNGLVFEIHDTSDQYECCSFSPGIYI